MLTSSPPAWRNATMIVLGGATSSSSGRCSIACAAYWVRSRHGVDHLAEPPAAGRAKRDQDLQRVEAPRRVERAADEVELALGLVLGPVEVDARVVDGAQDADVRDEQRAGAERHPPQLVQVRGDAVGALDALEAVAVAVGERQPGADRGVDVEPRTAFAAPCRRARRAGRSRRGRSCRPCRRSRSRARRSRDRVGVHGAGRVGGNADHRVGAEPEQRGRAADAVVRGLRRDDPPLVRRQPLACARPSPARSRASSSPSRFDAVPPIVITPEPLSPRPWSCASRVTSASSTNVPAGDASKASIDWLVAPTASSAAAAEISGAGWRWATRVRVAEPDAAGEDRARRRRGRFGAARRLRGAGRARRPLRARRA